MSKPRLTIGELKERFLPIFRRRSSDISQHSSSSTTSPLQDSAQTPLERVSSNISLSSVQDNPLQNSSEATAKPAKTVPFSPPSSTVTPITTGSLLRTASPAISPKSLFLEQEGIEQPVLTLERATPEDEEGPLVQAITGQEYLQSGTVPGDQVALDGNAQSAIVDKAFEFNADSAKSAGTSFSNNNATMPAQIVLHKKVWVKRQGASATLVQISEEDLVDDVREKILRKYANSLGRTFDSPDVTLRIIPRPDSHGQYERSLGPEESVAATLNKYYPAGQTIDEALVIDIPHRRTPRHSPRVYMEHRPSENGGDYFSAMPVAISHSPHLTSNVTMPTLPQQPMHAISILNTGQLPTVPLPSPGAISRRHTSHRPKYGRTTTSSPTVLTTSATYAKTLADRVPGTPGMEPLATPPISTVLPSKAATPPPRTASPRPAKTTKPKKPKKALTGSSQPTSLLDGGVPPISVLIVEDNIINLKLLEAFMKRLKVRWQTAMNGRDAVVKWRTGGFHLVLMDIQLPIMSGLEATREIRRLESVNGIGVLSAKVGDTMVSGSSSEKAEGNDQLQNMDQFKSPVIVVALTASSLQSDRHEALAAGCNDFLTKPVNFVWMERKVMEWGCMQALIDFDGWRQWKDFTQVAPTQIKMNKSTTLLGSSGMNNGVASTMPQNSNKRGKETHSDSTGTVDKSSTIPSKPPIPETLIALNHETESDDTIGSVDSVTSTDSIDTIELSSPRRAPLVSSLSMVSPSSSTSTVTASSTKGSLSRQSSAQSTRTLSSRDSFPLSPNRSALNGFPISPSTSASFEEGRRRKRASLGRVGLSGVAEELEGLGTL